MKSAKEYVKEQYGENWAHPSFEWMGGDVLDALKEYAAEVHKEDMEFAKWCVDAEVFHSANQKHWIYNADETSQLIFKTIDELLSFWQTNFKGK